MTRDRKQKPWARGVILACLVACGTLRAEDPSGESLLTVGRIFGVKELETESLPALRWSKRSSTYLTLEKLSTATGQELIRHDPATGKKEVVVPVTAFTPSGAKEPLKGESFEIATDESRVLIFTNRQILVQQFNRPQTELRVWRVDPSTGQAQPVFTEKDAAWLENENPWRWLDGGKTFLWLSERSGWRHASRAHIDGSPLEPITKGEFDVIGVEAVDPAGGWLYYTASPKDATRRYLFRVKLDGSKTERLSPEKQTGWHEYAFSHDKKWAVHTGSNFTTPPLVELVRAEDHGVVRTLTDNAKLRAKLAALKRPEVEFMRVPIGDGITLDGWSVKPAHLDAAAKLPLLMYVYGEPHGPTVRDAWPGPRGLWHWMLAQQGFVVALPKWCRSPGATSAVATWQVSRRRAWLPSPPVLRGRGDGGEGVLESREKLKASRGILAPLTPALSPRSTGGRGGNRESHEVATALACPGHPSRRAGSR